MGQDDRELRRHALRFLKSAPEGEQNSRILYMELLDYGHRITWREFDQMVLYLERAECVTVRYVRPEIDRTRILRLTQRGLDVVEGTVQNPGIMPPAQAEI